MAKKPKKFRSRAIRPLEISIPYDPTSSDWSLINGRWHHDGDYSEKMALDVLDISIQIIDTDGIERVVDVPDAPFEARLSGDAFAFVLPTDIDVTRLKAVWFRVGPRPRLRTIK